MEACHKIINYHSRKEEFTIYPLGDIHLGARGCDEKRLNKLLMKIQRDPYARVLGMGDYGDFIGGTDPRFESDGLADWIPTHKVSTLLEVQKDYIIEKLEPIKGKILGLLKGNHEDTITRHYGFDIHESICRALTVRNLSYSCFLRLRFERKGGDRFPIQIYAHHGHGGGRKGGAKVNRIHDMGADYFANVYLMGHTHERGWVFNKPMLDMHHKEERLIQRERLYGYTGSYLKTCQQNVSGYAEKAGFPPTSLGGISFKVKPSTRTIETLGGITRMTA